MRGSVLAIALLVSGTAGFVPAEASATEAVPAAVAGPASIPPDCKVWSDPRWGVGYSQCTARAHRVAVYCDFAKFPIMGPWMNKNEISQAQCSIGESPTRVSVDFPD